MKKTLTTLAVLGVVAAAPAFAGDMYHTNSTQNSTYSQQTVYRQVRVPLTPEQVAERQRMGTRIEQTINRLDTNADRELNRAEFSYSAHMFKFDTDNKTSAFYNADTNRDGQLSSQELLKAELAAREVVMVPVIEPASGTTRVIERRTTTVVR